MAQDEAEIRLLKYEAEFYRTCNVVRQNGVELHQLKSYLLKELLDLEIGKRKKIHEHAVNAIHEIQTSKEEQNIELCRLKRQLQNYRSSLNARQQHAHRADPPAGLSNSPAVPSVTLHSQSLGLTYPQVEPKAPLLTAHENLFVAKDDELQSLSTTQRQEETSEEVAPSKRKRGRPPKQPTGQLEKDSKKKVLSSDTAPELVSSNKRKKKTKMPVKHDESHSTTNDGLLIPKHGRPRKVQPLTDCSAANTSSKPFVDNGDSVYDPVVAISSRTRSRQSIGLTSGEDEPQKKIQKRIKRKPTKLQMKVRKKKRGRPPKIAETPENDVVDIVKTKTSSKDSTGIHPNENGSSTAKTIIKVSDSGAFTSEREPSPEIPLQNTTTESVSNSQSTHETAEGDETELSVSTHQHRAASEVVVEHEVKGTEQNGHLTVQDAQTVNDITENSLTTIAINSETSTETLPSTTNSMFKPPKALRKTSKTVTKPLLNGSHNVTSSTGNDSQLPSTKKRKTLLGPKSRNTSIFQLSIVDNEELPRRKTAIRVNTKGLGTLKLKNNNTN